MLNICLAYDPWLVWGVERRDIYLMAVIYFLYHNSDEEIDILHYQIYQASIKVYHPKAATCPVTCLSVYLVSIVIFP